MTEQFLTNVTFDDFMQRKGLSIVVFTAGWCAPCQDLKKILAVLCHESPDVSVAYVDIEAETELRDEFEICTVPWVMLVRDATVLFADSGSLSLEQMRNLVQQARDLDMTQVRE